MSSVANEVYGKAFDVQEITPEFSQQTDPDINQENAGQEGVQGTSEAFNTFAPPEPSVDIEQQNLEHYKSVNEDMLDNYFEQSKQLDNGELSNEQPELQENSLQESEHNYNMDNEPSL